jgi:prepilin-type N-terminal cleavage/methylation domain-containing protein
MKRFSLKYLLGSRAGFTLIEVMVALVITGILGLGATVATAQVMLETRRDSDYTAASRHATNAIYWISRDALMAQQIGGCDGFPAVENLTFSWTDWDNNDFSVEYAVEDGVLTRTYDDGIDTTTSRIAESINTGEDMTLCTSENGTVTLTVTSSVGSGDRIIDVTKTRVITNRPSL